MNASGFPFKNCGRWGEYFLNCSSDITLFLTYLECKQTVKKDKSTSHVRALFWPFLGPNISPITLSKVYVFSPISEKKSLERKKNKMERDS
jgi:hypothetical protein